MNEEKDWALLLYGVAESPLTIPADKAEDDQYLASWIDGELRAFVSALTDTALGEEAPFEAVAEAFRRAPELATIHCAYQVDYADSAGVPWPAGRRQQLGQGLDASYPPAHGFPPPRRNGDFTAFLDWAKLTCKAKRTVLIVWGHGFGPGGLFDGEGRNGASLLSQEQLERLGILYSPRQFRDAIARFKEGSGDLILLFKSCWMCTAEVACELGGQAQYLVASPSVVPMDQPWRHEWLLESMTRASTRQVAINLGCAVKRSYPDGDRARQGLMPVFSVVDVAAADGIARAFRGLVSRLGLLSGRNDEQLRAARVLDNAHTGPFTGEGATESGKSGALALIDIQRACRALIDDGLYREEAGAVLEATRQALVEGPHPDPLCLGISAFRYPSATLRHRFPLDIYVRDDVATSDYRETRFNQLTKNADGLDALTAIAFEH